MFQHWLLAAPLVFGFACVSQPPPREPSPPAAPIRAPVAAAGSAVAPPLPPLETAPAPTAPPDEDGDVSGPDLAQRIAGWLLANPAHPTEPGLPAPRSPSDNNPFALVRPAHEIAEEGPEFVLSPDGQRFVFVRPEQGRFPELWIADSDGANARRLVDLRTTESTLPDGDRGTIPSDSLFAPAFSADGRRVYFQTDGWATSLALYVVDVESGSVRFVRDANGFFVIRECRRASLVGALIAYRHSYSELPGSAVDWYFLLDPNGKQLGVVGDVPESVDRFLRRTCAASGAKLRQLPGCDGKVLRYEPKRFLDGTELELFYWVSVKDARRPIRGMDDHEWLGLPLSAEEAEAALEAECAR